jgi:hypothetical protein
MAENTVQQWMRDAARAIDDAGFYDRYQRLADEMTCDAAMEQCIREMAEIIAAHAPQDTAAIREQLAEEKGIIDRVWKALGISTYADAHGKAIDELVAERVAHVPQAAAAPVPEGITPLPWVINKYGDLVAECTYALVADVFDGRPNYDNDKRISRVNAAYIVQACNAYPALLSALGEAERALQAIRERTFVVTDSASAEYHKLSEIRQNTDAALSTIRALLPASD